MGKKRAAGKANGIGANLGFEQKPWLAADKGAGKYKDVPGFCKSAALGEIRQHGHVLTLGRHLGAEGVEDDEPFGEKMQRFVAQLNEQFAESHRLEKAIRKNLEGLGYGR